MDSKVGVIKQQCLVDVLEGLVDAVLATRVLAYDLASLTGCPGQTPQHFCIPLISVVKQQLEAPDPSYYM